MAVAWQEIQDEFISIAQRSGYFDTHQGHEAKNAPGKGIHFEVLYGGKRPSNRSGLHQTSVVVIYLLRVYCDMLREPADSIDVDLCVAADAIWDAVHGNYRFDIDGVRGGDLLGSEGEAMADEAGYISFGSGEGSKMYRAINIRVPVVINDAYNQEA